MIFQDLLAAHVLDAGDPYFGTNELRYAWVALSDWTYTLTLPRDYWMDEAVAAAMAVGAGVGREGHTGDPPSRSAGSDGDEDLRLSYFSFEKIEEGGQSREEREGDDEDGGGSTSSAAAAAAASVVGLLTFEGIDTFATVRVNGHEIGRYKKKSPGVNIDWKVAPAVRLVGRTCFVFMFSVPGHLQQYVALCCGYSQQL